MFPLTLCLITKNKRVYVWSLLTAVLDKLFLLSLFDHSRRLALLTNQVNSKMDRTSRVLSPPPPLVNRDSILHLQPHLLLCFWQGWFQVFMGPGWQIITGPLSSFVQPLSLLGTPLLFSPLVLYVKASLLPFITLYKMREKKKYFHDFICSAI